MEEQNENVDKVPFGIYLNDLATNYNLKLYRPKVDDLMEYLKKLAKEGKYRAIINLREFDENLPKTNRVFYFIAHICKLNKMEAIPIFKDEETEEFTVHNSNPKKLVEQIIIEW